MSENAQNPGTDPLLVKACYMDLHRHCVDTTIETQSISYGKKAPLQHFFTLHQLRKIHQDSIPVKKFQPDWIFGIIFLSFILLAWTNFYYHKRLRQIFMAPYSKRFLNQLVRDGNLFSERISVALSTVYILMLSLLLFQASSLVNPSRFFLLSGPIYLFPACLGVLVVYWLIKIALIRLIGITFKTGSTTDEYLLNVLIFNIITGLTILPFIVSAIYLKSSFILYFCFIILGIFFIFRFFRGFFIGISLRKFSYLFLFVYLCSLEFLPLIVLVKIFLIYYSTTIQVK